MQLELNKSETLIATLLPDDAVPIVLWESSDTGVAKVDGSGGVTAVSLGTATITATSRQGGKTDTCAVTVNTPHTRRRGRTIKFQRQCL